MAKELPLIVNVREDSVQMASVAKFILCYWQKHRIIATHVRLTSGSFRIIIKDKLPTEERAIWANDNNIPGFNLHRILCVGDYVSKAVPRYLVRDVLLRDDL